MRGRWAGLLALLLVWSCATNEVMYDRPPLPREELVQSRAGYIWVHGRWDRNGGQWVWHPGRYEALRAGYEYIEGRWEQHGRYYVWIEGEWQPVDRPGRRPRDE